METSKDKRDELRALVPTGDAKFARVEVRGDVLLALVADADRCAELEACFSEADAACESGRMLMVCDIVHDARQTDSATVSQWKSQQQRISELEAENERLREEVRLLHAIAEADLDDRCGDSTPESSAAHLKAHREYDKWKHAASPAPEST
jgi:predicted nuclease with TOPRIM domain